MSVFLTWPAHRIWGCVAICGVSVHANNNWNTTWPNRNEAELTAYIWHGATFLFITHCDTREMIKITTDIMLSSSSEKKRHIDNNINEIRKWQSPRKIYSNSIYIHSIYYYKQNRLYKQSTILFWQRFANIRVFYATLFASHDDQS